MIILLLATDYTLVQRKNTEQNYFFETNNYQIYFF